MKMNMKKKDCRKIIKRTKKKYATLPCYKPKMEKMKNT